MSVTIYPSKDAYTRDDNPTTNYGTVDNIIIGDLTSPTSYTTHGFIDFDFSTVDKYEMVSADMSFKPIYHPAVVRVDYSIITTSWSETGVTWNNEPSYSTSPYGSFNVDHNSPQPRTSESITAYVHDDLNGGSNHGFALFDTTLVSGSGNYANMWARERTGTTDDPRVIVTTFEDEGYYVSGSVDIPLIGSYICGNGEGDMNNYNTTSGDVYVAFQLPWADTYGSYQTYSYYDTNEWSTTGADYIEYFRVQYDSLWLIDGEYYVARFNYEWERVYDTGYWVSPYGDDDNSGRTKTHPWKTITYANSQIPNDSILNVRYGKYESETDIDPTSTGIKYQITHAQTSVLHTGSSAFVSGSTFGTGGDIGVPMVSSTNVHNSTIVQPNSPITKTGTLNKFYVGAYDFYGNSFNCKLKVLRINGSNYDVVWSSGLLSLPNGLNRIDVSVSVVVGDIVAAYFTSSGTTLMYIATDALVSTYAQKYSGDITTSTAISTGSPVGKEVCMYARVD